MSLTRQRFDDALDDLRRRLLLMGASTEEIVRDAIVALTNQDLALAATIVPRDDAIDVMEREVEELCLHLIARQQPLASDLRLIGTALKSVTDIERIGDHAVDIARITERIGGEMFYKPLVDVPRMGEMVRRMLHDALEAFVRRDLRLVDRVLSADDAVDELYARMKRELYATMRRDPESVLQASHLLFVAHYLERMGDHCCNIVERVAYMETGRLKSLTRGMTEAPPALEPPPPLVLVSGAV